MAAFAKLHGLKEQRLSWWKKRLGEWKRTVPAALAESAPRFVPAVVRASPAAMGSGAVVAIRFSDGTVVEVEEPERVAAAWLCELIAALQG